MFLCKLSPLVNKVLAKTEATVTLADGSEVNLIGGEFDPYDATYSDFIQAVIGALDGDLLNRTVGEFAEENGVFTIPVNLKVDMSNFGLMSGNIIEETIIINLHIFD